MTWKHGVGLVVVLVACSDPSGSQRERGVGAPSGSTGSVGATSSVTSGSTTGGATTGSTTTGAGGCTGVGPSCGNPIMVDASVNPGPYGEGGVRQPPCPGCQIVSCPAGTKTTVSGTVFAPNGTLPLYNVIVYVPIGEPKPFPSGANCDKCGKLNSASAFTTALSDAKGHFILEDMPVGKNVPFVVQVGKWRRQVSLPEVKACVDNPITDANLTRLPKSRTEGSMPMVAVTTGGSDSIACMLPKVGVDRSEFGAAGQGKAISFFSGAASNARAGAPAGSPNAESLWNDVSELKKYDMAVFSCEGSEHRDGDGKGDLKTKSTASFAAVNEYLNAGGRIFTTDFQYTWYKFSPDPNMQATGMYPGGAPSGDGLIRLDTSFPKGKGLADWLANLNPAAMYGTVSLDVVFDNVSSSNMTSAQVWGRGDQSIFGMVNPNTKNHPRFVTINAPAAKPVDQQCGKAVLLDAHIIQPGGTPGSSGPTDTVDTTFPDGCKRPMSAGEQAFAFFFFDLASCIQKEDAPVAPPPPDPR